MAQKKTDDKMTSAELRKLIRAHNVLVSIKIPKGSTREDIIKIILKEGYRVDHENKKLRPIAKGKVKKMKVISQKTVEEVLPKPKPKTALQKQKIAEAKAEKEEKKKKEQRAITKQAVEKAKKGMDRKKPLKNKSIERSSEDMKPKQPKQTQKFKSQKEDEVRPKEKVGRPKVDPKKIKVIEPKEKRKTDGEILKENGYPTLAEYKAEIVTYVDKIAKELGVKANIEASPKDFFDRQVGNLQRQFDFLAEKLRKGKN